MALTELNPSVFLVMNIASQDRGVFFEEILQPWQANLASLAESRWFCALFIYLLLHLKPCSNYTKEQKLVQNFLVFNITGAIQW